MRLRPTNIFIERKPQSDKYRIVGKGVTVEFLATLIDHPDWSVERICSDYGLTPAEVHAAWAFYYDHQDEIDKQLEREASPLSDEDVARRKRVSVAYQAKMNQSYPDDTDIESIED